MVKLEEVKEEQLMVSSLKGSKASGNTIVLQSPKTTPMLLPEVWEHIFKDLPPAFLKVMGLCPEWNQLLQPLKGRKLHPQVLELGVEGGFSREALMACRDFNAECRVAVDQAIARDDARISEEIRELHQILEHDDARIAEERLVFHNEAAEILGQLAEAERQLVALLAR